MHVNCCMTLRKMTKHLQVVKCILLGIDITCIYYLFKCRRCYKTLRQGNLHLARTQLSLYGKNTEFGMVKFHCKRHVEVVLLSLMKICMKN